MSIHKFLSSILRVWCGRDCSIFVCTNNVGRLFYVMFCLSLLDFLILLWYIILFTNNLTMLHKLTKLHLLIYVYIFCSLFFNYVVKTNFCRLINVSNMSNEISFRINFKCFACVSYKYAHAVGNCYKTIFCEYLPEVFFKTMFLK